MYKRGKITPFLGAAHGTDVPEFYGLVLPDFIATDALSKLFAKVERLGYSP